MHPAAMVGKRSNRSIWLLLCLEAAAANLQLLQWNPHWQCFAWDQHNCSQHAEAEARTILKEDDIDFANLVEFEEVDLQTVLPDGWTSIRSNENCTQDKVNLVYNSRRWAPGAGDEAGTSGCLIPADRPYIIQQFDYVGPVPSNETNETNESNSSSGADAKDIVESIVVIGAHFPHPKTFNTGELQGDAEAILRGALRAVMDATNVTRVLLIADTNEFNFVTSSYIAGFAGFPGDKVISSSLERTCCFDNDYKESDTFDRVISNFGAEMQTRVLFEEVPEWAKQINGTYKGAFHKAVRATLHMHPTEKTKARMKEAKLIAIVLACVGAALVCVGVFIALVFACGREPGQAREGKLAASTDESSSENDV